MPSRKIRRWYFTAFALLGLAACGLGPATQASRVIVDQLATDVVFGAGTPASAKLPPVSNRPQPEPSLFLGNDFGFVPSFGGQASCGVAPSTGAPAQQATTQVDSKPVVGEYRWLASGVYEAVSGAATLKLHLFPYFFEDVRRVQDQKDSFPALPGSTPGLVFAYQTVQPSLGGNGYVVYTWKVKTQPQTGDPEGGLSLQEIDLYNGAGDQLDTLFKSAPNEGLLVLPLPVSSGVVGIQGPNGGIGPTTSVDTTSHGTNMQYTANVTGRERLDACGTWIQAWAIDGDLKNGANTTHWHLDVATQFGALVVGMNFNGTFLGTKLDDVKTRYGQTSPNPLPKRWR